MRPSGQAVIAAVAIITGLAGCGKSEEPPQSAEVSRDSATPVAPDPAPAPAVPAPAPALGRGEWLAQEINGKHVQLTSESRRPTIRFDLAAGGASGYAGCNTFQGKFRASDKAIHLGPFATTRRACLDTENLELEYLSAMSQTTNYRAEDDALEFLNAQGQVVVRFALRGASPR